MSDLISRKAAKRIIDNIDTFCAGWRDYAKEQIDSSPTAEKVGKWIPVSERLPEKNGEYLVTEIDHITYERLTDIAYYGDFTCTNNGFHKANDIVAWMPLPEPWRGEEDE